MIVTEISERYKNKIDCSTSVLNNWGPDWEITPHKGMQSPKDAEFDAIIDNLGESLAEALIKKDGAKYTEIRSFAEKRVLSQYISVVSPDRKALVKETLQFINSAPTKPQKSSGGPLTLIDYLNMKNGLLKPSTRGRFSIELNSGTTITFTGSDLQPDCFEIKRSTDVDPVIEYDSGEWYVQRTSQELTMQQDFLRKLNSTEKKYEDQFKLSTVQSNNKLNTLT